MYTYTHVNIQMFIYMHNWIKHLHVLCKQCWYCYKWNCWVWTWSVLIDNAERFYTVSRQIYSCTRGIWKVQLFHISANLVFITCLNFGCAVAHCCFHLHFPEDWECWAPFISLCSACSKLSSNLASLCISLLLWGIRYPISDFPISLTYIFSSG